MLQVPATPSLVPLREQAIRSGAPLVPSSPRLARLLAMRRTRLLALVREGRTTLACKRGDMTI